MQRTIAYDASCEALLHPDRGPTVFQVGVEYTEDQICAETSRLVYKKFDRDPAARRYVLSALSAAGFSDVQFVCSGGTEALVAASPARALSILAFRGTEQDIRDVATDLRFVKTGWATGGEVHAGFAKGLSLVWLEVAAALERSGGRVLYTGHSLGGALATLAAGLRRPDRLVTFGSPRVGDAVFSLALRDLPIARYVNCCDWVCRIPPVSFSFQHAGARRYIDGLGLVRERAPEADVARDRRQARREHRSQLGWRLGNVPVRGLSDHAPINYVAALFGLPAPLAPRSP